MAKYTLKATKKGRTVTVGTASRIDAVAVRVPKNKKGWKYALWVR